jgi:predicted acylesterase/phospholipase RssA
METNLETLLGPDAGTTRHLRRGDVLFHQGNRGSSFYLVQSGRLRAIRDLDGEHPVLIGEIGRGELVGEMAVLGDAPRSASVVAIRDSQVTEFSGADLAALPKESLLEVMRVLATRIRRLLDASGRKQSLPACIVVLPVGPGLPVDEYCQRLHDSLVAAGGRCALVRGADLPAEFAGLTASDGAEFRRLGHWLDEAEGKHGMLLLQADWEVTPWTERCLRQADLILLLAKASAEPSKGPAERAIERLPGKAARPRIDLVLLQDEPPYRGTAAWLAGREITRHHHVRLHSEADKARAGRMLTGSDVSLAFGGGGARGFAHIGILRACEELGIPVDRVGGTSMGSIIGGLAAMGFGWQDVTERIRAQFIPKRRLTQFTLPLLSLDTSRRYIRALEALYGTTLIEDLPINFFCVSCNLTRASVLVHREGPLAKWVGASISVPGIAPPLVEHGELIVDGGLLNNLPVDIAKEDGAGMVVGIDVSPQTEFRLPAAYSGRPQAWDVLWSRISGRRRDDPSSLAKPVFPTLAALLYRATSLSSVAGMEKSVRLADCYIKLPVDGYRLLDFEALDPISAIGYESGLTDLQPVAEWVRTRRQPPGPAPATPPADPRPAP